MKVVLSGATGYIGGEVLNHCLNHPSITSVLILTRRDPGTWATNPKAKVVIVEDFTAYDQDTIAELKTADAALWCLGTFNGNEKVDIDYPLAFIDIIKARPAGSKTFRYVQLGGAFTEPPPKDGEQERTLWYYTNGRRVRGRAEAKVRETSDDSAQSAFTVYLVKPGGVQPKEGLLRTLTCFLPESLMVGIAELGATMVDLALHGSEQRVFSSQEIAKHGRGLLEKSA